MTGTYILMFYCLYHTLAPFQNICRRSVSWSWSNTYLIYDHFSIYVSFGFLCVSVICVCHYCVSACTYPLTLVRFFFPMFTNSSRSINCGQVSLQFLWPAQRSYIILTFISAFHLLSTCLFHLYFLISFVIDLSLQPFPPLPVLRSAILCKSYVFILSRNVASQLCVLISLPLVSIHHLFSRTYVLGNSHFRSQLQVKESGCRFTDVQELRVVQSIPVQEPIYLLNPIIWESAPRLESTYPSEVRGVDFYLFPLRCEWSQLNLCTRYPLVLISLIK